jgi:hypothetical protein
MNGRPRVEIDQDQFESLCRLNPTLKDAAAFFKCSEDTIERRAKDFGYQGFADARAENMVHTRLDLIRKAVSMGKSGNVPMLIFSLKNLCGWKDKQDVEVSSGTIQINIDKQDSEL